MNTFLNYFEINRTLAVIFAYAATIIGNFIEFIGTTVKCFAGARKRYMFAIVQM